MDAIVTTLNFPPNLLQLTQMIGELQTLASEQRDDAFLARADEVLSTLNQWDHFRQNPFRERVLEELRSSLSVPETRSDGLATFDQLVHALAYPVIPSNARSELARITGPVQNLPGAFWRHKAMAMGSQSSLRPAAIEDWQKMIGLEIFEKLRLEHILPSEEGATPRYLYALFAPRTGHLMRTEMMKTRWGGGSTLSPNSANVILTYDLTDQRLGLNKPFAGRAVTDSGIAQGLISPEVVRLIDSLDGQRVIFPVFSIPRQAGEEGTIPEIEPAVFRENAHFAQTALDGMRAATMETVLSVSVAPNGLFVGFQYWLPASPNEIYEVGMPQSGTKAIVSREIYRNRASFEKLLWFPTEFKWTQKPNAYQKTAVLKWRRFVENQLASGNDWRHLRRPR